MSFKVKDGGESVSIMGLVVPLNEDFFNCCRKKFKNYKIVDMGLAVNKKKFSKLDRSMFQTNGPCTSCGYVYMENTAYFTFVFKSFSLTFIVISQQIMTGTKLL